MIKSNEWHVYEIYIFKSLYYSIRATEINMLITASASDTELFALASQLYVRLRRVNGRVIDVQYMMESREYADYVVSYASKIEDEELQRQVGKIERILNPEQIEMKSHDTEMVSTKKVDKHDTSFYSGNWF